MTWRMEKKEADTSVMPHPSIGSGYQSKQGIEGGLIYALPQRCEAAMLEVSDKRSTRRRGRLISQASLGRSPASQRVWFVHNRSEVGFSEEERYCH